MAPLKQTATIWRATPDGFGGYTYAAPAIFSCRWEEKIELLPGSSTEVSKAVVYSQTAMSPEDRVYLGTSYASDPSSVQGVHAIKMYQKIPDLRNLQAIHKSWLV